MSAASPYIAAARAALAELRNGNADRAEEILATTVERGRPSCGECGQTFAWPGELDEHTRRYHGCESD
jgi:hypothetical protein